MNENDILLLLTAAYNNILLSTQLKLSVDNSKIFSL